MSSRLPPSSYVATPEFLCFAFLTITFETPASFLDLPLPTLPVHVPHLGHAHDGRCEVRPLPAAPLPTRQLTFLHYSAALTCSSSELVSFTPASGQTCATYMSEYIATNGGALYGDTASTTACSFCASTETNTYLTELGMSFDDAWRNFGFMWCYIAFKCVFLLPVFTRAGNQRADKRRYTVSSVPFSFTGSFEFPSLAVPILSRGRRSRCEC